MKRGPCVRQGLDELQEGGDAFPAVDREKHVGVSQDGTAGNVEEVT